MKISLLTLYTPTHENVNGPSALPYYLLKYRGSDIDVEIFSFNLNKISEEKIHLIEQSLKLKIHIWNLPRWFVFINKYHLTKIRVFFKYPLYCYIQPSKKQLLSLVVNNPDLIWHYIDTFVTVSKKLPRHKHLITGPDSPALVYTRQIIDAPSFHNIIYYLGLAKVTYAAVKQIRYPVGNNVVYHLVGKEDCKNVRSICPEKRCFFLHHPHYELCKNVHIDFHKETISILIAGHYNYRTISAIDEVVRVLVNMDVKLKQSYSFTFIGKFWEKPCKILQDSGWKADHIKWVEDYVDSIAKYDIFLYPIHVGSGTKGKMLDAIANGLLAIGTDVALENIEVVNGESCIVYQDASELTEILNNILENPSRYETMAQIGMERVRQYHAPQKCSVEFFNKVKDICD